MEKVTRIPATDFRKGFYIELECGMCGHKETLAADTEEELYQLIDEGEWSNLDSDLYGLSGYYCGCDYDDDYEDEEE